MVWKLRMCAPMRGMKRRIYWMGVVLVLSAVGATGAIAFVSSEDRVLQAQQQVPPSSPAIVFNGKVTINGDPPKVGGLSITARIGDKWESPPVLVVAEPNRSFEYAHLIVATAPDLDLIGSQIEFWLNGEVKSTVTNWFAVINEFDGEVCGDCMWPFPIQRELDLDFPHLPDPLRTLSPSPTPFDDLEPPPLPAGFPPLAFRGAVTIDNKLPTDPNLNITARIGSEWESTPVRVRRLPQRTYQYSHLEIQPPDALDLSGSKIEFWLGGRVRADATSVFAPYNGATGEFCTECPWTFPELRTLNLNFPHHPDDPPSPTPTPQATATLQRSAPQYPIVIFSGRVIVNGQAPNRSGFEVTARIGDVWQSHPVVVGTDPDDPFDYEYLIIAPDEELNLIGSHIEFWIDDQVKASTKSVFAFLPGESCDDCESYSKLPVLRQVDLEFSRLPDPTPTPTSTVIATSTFTSTPSPSATAIPTVTPTATPVARIEIPTPTPTPIPTPSPVPPTATPEPVPTVPATSPPVSPTAIATIMPTPTRSPAPSPSPVPPTSTPSPTQVPPTIEPSPTASPTSTREPTPTPFIPPIATPASTDPDARANATTTLAVIVLLTVLASLAYIRWRYRRRSKT